MTPWLLPGELARGPARRTTRDWAADVTLFGFAVWAWFAAASDFPPSDVDFVPGWMVTVNPWVGGLACLSLWWRRRFPTALALALVPCLVVAASSLGAAMVAVLTVAIHRHWSRACLVTAFYLLTVSYYAFSADPPGLSRLAVIVSTAMLFLIPLTLGLAVRARRLTIHSLRREAAVREREHLIRLSETRRTERELLAREMHDVLAHRISLLSVHAGALAYRTARASDGQAPPLEAAEVDEAVQIIQSNARLALDELTEVLSILRADPAPPDPPVSALAEMDQLLEEATASGQRIRMTRSGPVDRLRPSLGRTAYRIVQEGLTNARKHASGAEVQIHLTATEDEGLDLHISNPVLPGSAASAGGYGLAGLAERVNLENGTLQHRISGGHFVLSARLPW